MTDRIRQNYFDDVQAYPLLSREDERTYLIRAKHGDKEALDKLVCCNQRFIIRVATLFQGQGLDLLELINEGTLGLIKSISGYNLKSKIRFLSYAVWWIRQSMIKAIYEKVRVVKLPFNRSGLLFKYLKKSYETLSDKTLAKMLKITLKELDELKILSEGVISFENPLPECDGKVVGDLLKDNADDPEKEVAKKYLRKYINTELKKLDKDDAMILCNYFGLNGSPFTLNDIAKRLGLTRERIRQRKKAALKKMQVLMRKYGGENIL